MAMRSATPNRTGNGHEKIGRCGFRARALDGMFLGTKQTRASRKAETTRTHHREKCISKMLYRGPQLGARRPALPDCLHPDRRFERRRGQVAGVARGVCLPNAAAFLSALH